MNKKLSNIDKRNKIETCGVEYSPDDNYLIIGDWNGNIYLFDKHTSIVKILLRFDDSMVESIIKNNETYYFLICPKADKTTGKIGKNIKIIEWKYPFDKYKPIEFNFQINSSTILRYKQGVFIINDHFNKEVLFYDQNKKIKHRINYKGVLKDMSISNTLEYFALIFDDTIQIYNLNKYSLIKEENLKYACFVDFTLRDEYILIGSWNIGLVIKVLDFISI